MQTVTTPELETIIGHSEKFDQLEQDFDRNSYGAYDCLSLLRQLKVYLRRHPERHDWFKGTLLRGSDCTTLAVVATTLARRKGYDVRIARPEGFGNFCHALLVYDEEGKEKTFRMTGKRNHDNYVMLSDRQVATRLRLTAPFIEFINRYIRKKYK